MTIPLVALSTDRSKMRRLRLLIVTGAIAFLSSILILDPQVDAQTSPTATDDREDSPDATAVVAPSVKDKIDLSTISKAIVNEASRLKNDAAGWDQKLQELKLDLDLKKNRQDFEGMAKDVDECLVVLRTAADRLAPDAEGGPPEQPASCMHPVPQGRRSRDSRRPSTPWPWSPPGKCHVR